jgi:agmatine/peptidylarginine deiminase
MGLLAVAAVSFLAGARWGAGSADPADSRARPGGPARAADSISVRTVRPDPESLRIPPGEFERQSALILPCGKLVWDFPRTFVDLVAAAHRSVPLICLAADERERQLAMRLLADLDLPAGAVRFVVAPTNSMWARDYAPLFHQHSDGEVGITDFAYVKMTGKEPRPDDNAVPKRVAVAMDLPVDSVPLTLEAGNLLTNGDGLCLTSDWVFHANARRGYGRTKIEQLLRERFGFRRWVVVRRLERERTGHVDMFVTFVAPNVAVVGKLNPAVDPRNAAIADKAAEILSVQQTSLGPMKVHRIPMPPKANNHWRSYTNVVFANGTLLVPTFSDVDPAMQDEVLGLYKRLLPGWKVVGINSDSVGGNFGLLHCLTRNVPAYVSLDTIPPAH